MKKPQIRSFLLIGCLIALTCAALAYSKQDTPFIPDGIEPVTARTGPVTLTGELTQDKILAGGDGITALSLTLTAEEMPSAENREVRQVDMVIVLDRSGSMEGAKLNDAKRAVRDLLGRLSSKDRFALVSYSSGVQRHSGLVPVTASTRESLMHQINSVYSGGGTNLGAGLQLGINTLMEGGRTGNLGRVILISDGLANEGVTDTTALGDMAGIARKREFGIS
ncbi:MAG: vWA domain-containing protein, partial [Thermodesulfobacteriota bacterium]